MIDMDRTLVATGHLSVETSHFGVRSKPGTDVIEATMSWVLGRAALNQDTIEIGIVRTMEDTTTGQHILNNIDQSAHFIFRK
jgi:hypothetical protein